MATCSPRRPSCWRLGSTASAYETAPAPLADLRGTWEFKLSRPDGGSETIVVKLGGEPNELSGSLHRGAKEAKLANVVLDGAQWSATFKAAPLDWTGVVQLSATLLLNFVQPGADAAAFRADALWFGDLVRRTIIPFRGPTHSRVRSEGS